ncbi:MAG: acetyl-CoA acetyltransferase [Candidatus Lokiarchaeota archaeon]|nr:acetyl-CoA acetyltransferase [Candidatus Lokiarchaeota archaeon]MBD3200863.1 acetyl-CoA acetyltransferase [Candidatus Lokiarchaeota archaeon]
MTRVCVIGIGHTDFNSMTPGMGWKEFMYEACNKAYMDAGIDPRRDIDSFITCAEDYWEGFSIFDEFVPDQIGALLRPCCTVCGDGIYGLGNAYMQIQTGLMNVVSIEAHSKASDLLTYGDIMLHAFDPIYDRPVSGPVQRPNYAGSPSYTEESPKPLVGASDEKERIHPYFLAGLEMQHYLRKTKTTEEQCAMVAVQNKRNAFSNPYADYELNISVDDVMKSEYCFSPLKNLDVSPTVDGAVCFVLASEDFAREIGAEPIYLSGFGWSSETPWLSTRGMEADYAKKASKMAYKMAEIKQPTRQIDLVEVDDRFTYKQLQHLEALGFAGEGQAGRLIEDGSLDIDGWLPTNPSGGSLGVGNCLEATGLQKSLEIVTQLRGHAGKRQIADAQTGLAQSWRGIPSGSGAVAIFTRG